MTLMMVRSFRKSVWQRKDEILQSVKGIGFVISLALLADCPELGALNRHQIAKLAGAAPLNFSLSLCSKMRGKHFYGSDTTS